MAERKVNQHKNELVHRVNRNHVRQVKPNHDHQAKQNRAQKVDRLAKRNQHLKVDLVQLQKKLAVPKKLHRAQTNQNRLHHVNHHKPVEAVNEHLNHPKRKLPLVSHLLFS